MAIKRPDIYEHNNQDLAIVDSDFVRGGGRIVANLTELYALYTKVDQLKEQVTKVYVTAELKTYTLVNILDVTNNVFNPTAWEIVTSGSGGHVITSDIESFTQRSNLKFIGGVTITDDDITDTTIVEINSGIETEVDPEFNAWLDTDPLSGYSPTTHNHTGVYEAANSNIQSHISSTSNPHSVTKNQIGLGNVDNTSDVNKPVSTYQAIAIGSRISSTEKGVANGVATLDGYGKIPVSQMPSMADDVVEILGMYPGNPTGPAGSIYYNTNAKTLLSYNGSTWVGTGSPVAGKLYLNQSDGISYKWNGTDLIATTSALPYASQSDAESGTSYSKVMSPKRVKQSYDYDISNRQLVSLGNKSVSTAISDINTTLSTINEHWRGSYISLASLKTAIPVANPGDEATIDAGVGTQAQKAIWDETDQDWYISSGTPVTVDQSINEGSINAVAGGAVFNALGNKVDKVAGKSLLDDTEISKLAKINVNTVGPEYTVTGEEKTYITDTHSAVSELQSLWGSYSRIQNGSRQFVSNVMNLEKEYAYYTMDLAVNSSITFNTSLLDSGKVWAFDVYFNVTNFISVAFPANVFFYGGNQMYDVGLFHYHFESKDNGITWIANLVSKKVNFISGTGKIIYVKTPANGGSDSNDGLTWGTAKATISGANSISTKGDVIFVQYGKYYVETYRTAGVNNTRSFIINDGVNVYGGFYGTELSPDERAMTTITETLDNPYGLYTYDILSPVNVTTFSGEINGNLTVNTSIVYGNRLTGASTTNNALNVIYFTGSSTTIIDGITIMGGYNTAGHGALIYGNSFLLARNCIFNDTTGSNGAAGGGNAILYLCKVSNSNIKFISGVIGNLVSIVDTTINNCLSGLSHANNNRSTYNHCKFLSNTFPLYNFFAYIYNSVIDSCTNTGNISNGGATLINFTIKNSNFPNFIPYGGLIIGITGKIINNSITGGITATLTNVLVAHNYCAVGILQSCVATNVTAVKNMGVTHGAFVGGTLINCVSWGNRIDGLKDNVYGGTVSYSAFENEVVAGTSNISISVNNTGDANSPKFKIVEPLVGNTTNMFDYDIDAGSFLIDKGNNTYPTNGDGSLYDCKGGIRKVGTVDIGAYEKQ